MPIINVDMWKGISQEHIETIIEGITKVFTDMGIPQEAVQVIIREVPKAHWGIDGQPATKSRKDTGM